MKIKRKDLRILIENMINELGPVASKDVFITYTVQKGDNLNKIADLIPYGQVMNIEEIDEFIEPGDKEKYRNSSIADPEFHLVFDQSVDVKGPYSTPSLNDFVKNLFVEDIIEFNNLSNPNDIKVGQKLKIPIDGPSSSVAKRLARGHETRYSHEEDEEEFDKLMYGSESETDTDLKLGR